jgi:rhodanese-related sulfurtransferase
MAATEKAPETGEICLITSVKDVPRMSVDELKSRLSDPSLIIIDIRAPGDWIASSTKIKGAFRETLDKIEEWAPRYDKDKNIVLLCAWPSEATSARAALILYGKGFKNVYALKGGWYEWEKAGYPVESKWYSLQFEIFAHGLKGRWDRAILEKDRIAPLRSQGLSDQETNSAESAAVYDDSHTPAAKQSLAFSDNAL